MSQSKVAITEENGPGVANIQNVVENVMANIKQAQERQKRNCDKRRTAPDVSSTHCAIAIIKFHYSQQAIPVGTQVLKRNLKRTDRKGGKQEDRWLGPHIVREVTKKKACTSLAKEEKS